MHDVIASDMGSRATPSSGQTNRPAVTAEGWSPLPSPRNLGSLALVSAGLRRKNICSYQKGG